MTAPYTSIKLTSTSYPLNAVQYSNNAQAIRKWLVKTNGVLREDDMKVTVSTSGSDFVFTVSKGNAIISDAQYEQVQDDDGNAKWVVKSFSNAIVIHNEEDYTLTKSQSSFSSDNTYFVYLNWDGDETYSIGFEPSTYYTALLRFTVQNGNVVEDETPQDIDFGVFEYSVSDRPVEITITKTGLYLSDNPNNYRKLSYEINPFEMIPYVSEHNLIPNGTAKKVIAYKTSETLDVKHSKLFYARENYTSSVNFYECDNVNDIKYGTINRRSTATGTATLYNPYSHMHLIIHNNGRLGRAGCGVGVNGQTLCADYDISYSDSSNDSYKSARRSNLYAQLQILVDDVNSILVRLD